MRAIVSILLCLGGIASAQEMKVEELYNKHCSGCHGAKFEGGVGGSLVDGQWKRGSEIPETRNGIPEAHGASRFLEKGYVLEAVIPASLIPDVKLTAGTRLSGLLLLAIRGKPEHSEVGWPATKGHGTGGGMETWPLLVLGN